jgi:uncharacterized membrane protein YgcG
MAVNIPIISEFDSKGIKSAINEFKSLEGAGAKAQFALKKAALPAAAAIGGLAVVIGDATKAAIEDAKAQALLAQAIEQNTLAGAANVKQAEAFIEKTMMSAAVADDELRPALAQLVQVTGDLGLSQNGVNLALDIAAGTGVDLATATDAVAKAYGGNTRALGNLLPGVRDLIKGGASLDEIFAAVAGTVGGAAATAADTAEGRMKRLSLTIGETKESIGAAFLPILEKLLPYLQRFAEYAQNNSDTIVKVMLAVGALAGGILALNAVLKVITVTQLALNLAMAANPIGLVVTAVALLVAGFGVLVAKTGGVKNAFATMGNFIIGIFERIANTYVDMLNLIIRGLNLLPGVSIDPLGSIELGRFNISKGGSGATAAGPDFLERQFATPSIPSVSPLTLPAPAGGGGGGGGGGSRAGGGGLGGGAGGDGGQFFTTPGFFGPLDPAELADFLARSEQRTMPDINITVNAAIAEASLGQTIVDALTDYTRSSGPLELQIAV